MKNGKIYQYDMDGNFIAEFETIYQCVELYGICNVTIQRSLNGYRPVNSKFIFSRIYYIKYPVSNLKRKKVTISKTIYQYDLDGNFIREWESASIAAKEYNVTRASVTSAANDKIKDIKSSAGYLWNYKKFDRLPAHTKNWITTKILQLDLNGNFIKSWSSIIEASKELKIHKGNISAVASPTSRKKSAGGYIWKYKD